jgi:Animal haem peroxidase
MLAKALMPLAERLDRRFGWQRLPYYVGLATLVGLRERLRQRNLYSTGVPGVSSPEPPTARTARQTDGSFNDLSAPGMGIAGAPFGRNGPSLPDPDPLGAPHPIEISDALMHRERFLGAGHLSVLASAWLQFEVHDWMSHAKEPPIGDWLLAADMPLPKAIPTGTDPEAYVCREPHWWDASQLYGTHPEYIQAIERDGGEIAVDDDLLQAQEQQAISFNAPEASLWVGLASLLVLFAHEHNAIARHLRAAYPGRDAGWIYAKARLINSALMAKIHTVEWTPAMIGHPTTIRAIKSTWWGLLGPKARRGRNEFLTGIPGSRANHHDVPYTLTEEFVTVYRLHPLLPDDYTLGGQTYNLRELAVQPPDKLGQPRERINAAGGNGAVLRALGTQPPGQVELFNYPTTMRRWERIGGLPPIDLAAADILRSRETGVPRYTAFRQLLRLPVPTSFEELAGGIPHTAAAIREVYEGEIDRVDAVVGLYAEPKPHGFAFSETAFRIFLLMAARRLQSDRFFTDDYTPQTYTAEGLRWIDESTMNDVLRRAYPGLTPPANPFLIWPRSLSKNGRCA